VTTFYSSNAMLTCNCKNLAEVTVRLAAMADLAASVTPQGGVA
jgi:hypothetical protein